MKKYIAIAVAALIVAQAAPASALSIKCPEGMSASIKHNLGTSTSAAGSIYDLTKNEGYEIVCKRERQLLVLWDD